MKKILLITLSILLSHVLLSQVPKRMSFQAIIMHPNGLELVNSTISMRVSILIGSSNGNAVFIETHQPTTNNHGLISIEIGGGNAILGSIDSIQWGASTYFLKTETDINGSGNYTLEGVSQLLSVPYALYSEYSKNPGPKGNDGTNGKDGKPGTDGVGIDSLFIRSDSLISLFTDSAIYNLGNIRIRGSDPLYIYVDHFGAIPDSINFDNSTAIQAALDSAIASGKILVFGKGNYYVSKSLIIRKHKTNEHDEGPKIIGTGVSTTAIVSKVNTGPLLIIENANYINGNPIPGYFFKGGFIKNILFQGYSGKGNCMNINGWWYGLLENIQIRNFDGHGIEMPVRNNFGPPNDQFGNAYTDNYSSFISIKNSQIDNNNGWGYYDGKENTSSDLNADKSVFASNRLGGIRFGGQSIRLTGCAIAYNGFGSNTGGGLELGINGNSSHNNFISQIEFDGNNQYHIKLNSVLNNTIVQNRFLFHDLVDSAKMSPSMGAILLASDSLYPYAANINISSNYIRVDYPTRAFNKRQHLYFTRFLSHASTYNVKIFDNLFQSLPTGFTTYHDFTRYDYYFDSRLGITNNILINDPTPGVFNATSRGQMPPFFDGDVLNSAIDTLFNEVRFQFPLTLGSYNILNLEENIQFYDSSTATFTIPESGYYDLDLGLGIMGNQNTTYIYIQVLVNNAVYSTHTYVANPVIENWVTDHQKLYFSKGEKVVFKCKSTEKQNLNVTSKSKLFFKLI